MRIGVVGAGVSGLAAARVLVAAGHDVTLYEERDDVGGVWSASRRYPNVSTQDDRESYAFSDAPMPGSYPVHPTGEQVQAYLHAYAVEHGLLGRTRLVTTVVEAALVDDQEWSLRTRDATGGEQVETVDLLVLANGVFSAPHVPEWPGREGFERAGGAVVEPTRVGRGEVFGDRDVVVVGWGKTACDVAVAAVDRARSVTLVARELWWKYPKTIGRSITFKYLLLTRTGERLLAAAPASWRGWLARVPSVLPRRLLLRHLRRTVDAQLGLADLGLRPSAGFAASNSLVTEGFFEAVREGDIVVVPKAQVADVGVAGDRPVVVLADSCDLPADLVVPATGFEQELDLLAPAVRDRLLEPSGELLLHRQVLPLRVPRLAFVGWSQSYRSPLTAEVQAWWLAGVLGGLVEVPPPEQARVGAGAYQLTHVRARAARLPQVPSTPIGGLDLLLRDLGMRLPRRVRLRQQLQPMRPADYAFALPILLSRLTPAASRAPVRR